MSVSDVRAGSSDNALHRLVAVSSLFLAALLLLGALGHLSAVWPGLDELLNPSDQAVLPLLWPGLILLAGSGLNAGLGVGLWQGRPGAVRLALAVNLALAVYLSMLLIQGVPGHPIGIFLALVSSHLIVLLAILFGLTLERRE